MKRVLNFLFLCVVVQLGSMPGAGASSRVPRPATKVITLERTQCFGTCPTYKLAIYSNGRVEFEGIHYVKTIGAARGRISRAKLNALVREFQKLHYFDLENAYDGSGKKCNGIATDMPSAITSLTWKGKSKTIDHYYGCMGVPLLKRLTALEEKIDETVKVRQWTK